MKSQKQDLLDRLGSELRPINREGLAEHLVRQMKSWVLRGLVRPGERLPPERELASMLNVSRASLRQALKTLEVMGVLEARQGSGTFLTESADNILRQPTDLLIPLRGLTFGELFEARRGMESEAAAAAALRASESDLQRLRRELEQMRLHLDDPVSYVKYDMAFHRHIACAAGNSVLLWFQELVSKALAGGWLARAKEGHSKRTFAEHQAILQAIEAREPEMARAAMLRHLMLSKFYSQEPTSLELRVTASDGSQLLQPLQDNA